MAYLEEIYQIKNKVIDLILESQPIIDAIDNQTVDTNKELIGKNIYRDLYIPDTQDEAKTYICVTAYVNKVQDKLIKTVDLNFYIFTHQSIMNFNDTYTRVDCIQSKIDKIINGNYDFGIDATGLKGSRQFRPNAKFGGVELSYTIPNLNQDRCGGFDKY